MHLLLSLVTLTALRVPGPLSPRNANYTIHASLDEKDKVVKGKERLHWKNIGSGAADTMVFHLYMNAFKNDQSTFMKETKGEDVHRGQKAKEKGWGAIDVTKLVVGGVDVTKDFKVDDTLGSVKLPAPVAAGAEVDVDVEFMTKMPKVFARTGYHDDFIAVGQWFPKIGVWDCAAGPHGHPASCRWRAHQHHLNSEFFADYGVYDVDVDVPKNWVVGASGVLTAEKTSGERKTVSYHAEDVHDFVWTTSPKFKITEDKFTDAVGEVRILMLSQPGRDANVPRHLRATREGLAELTRRFGPYPYSQITVVDVPEGAEGAGGMEYPTLFFTEDMPVPPSFHLPEYVTVHELSHQYFYGLVGSDEVEEAWLDEGFTETMSDWGISRMFGREGSVWELFGHHFSATELEQQSYRTTPTVDPLEVRAFDYESNHSYGSMTYAKTALVMRTMEDYLGHDKFEAAMRHYYDKARFTHPRGEDFVRLFDEGAGQDLSWFWQPALWGSQTLDYQILAVDKRRKRAPTGMFEEGADNGGHGKRVEKEEPKKPDKDAPWISEVVVHRKGEIAMPVEIKVVFEDGSEKHETWDGGAKPGEPRWKRFVYETPKPVVWAEVDPEGKLALDA
ncbi:MAG: peptidase rane alanine aminopeptidase, partial [bacterium]|nr:peptidase rane alanine aminopeptidase [bacterium]